MKSITTRPIRTYDDLLMEKQQLEQQLTLQKAEFRYHAGILKNKLNPVEKIAGVMKNITTPDTRNPLVNTGLNLIIDVVLKGFYMSKIGWLPKLVVPFVLKNVSSNVVNKNGKSWVKMFRSFVGKTSKKKDKPASA
jgi:hypothetical protein